jgi:outer membrane protein assembly factor BamB
MDNRTAVFSLDETTGASLWSYNVGSLIYQPVEYNGLLVFEAADGHVYALHMSDGTLAWKTYVDSQNMTAQANSDNPLKALAIQIDPQNQRAIGGYAVTNLGGTEYSGFLCSLDLDDGSVIWNTQFSADGDVSHENALFNFALTKSEIYLTTEFSDLWIINKSTGKIIKTQTFEHYILPPVVADNRAFVAADLWLIAYE